MFVSYSIINMPFSSYFFPLETTPGPVIVSVCDSLVLYNPSQLRQMFILSPERKWFLSRHQNAAQDGRLGCSEDLMQSTDLVTLITFTDWHFIIYVNALTLAIIFTSHHDNTCELDIVLCSNQLLSLHHLIGLHFS